MNEALRAHVTDGVSDYRQEAIERAYEDGRIVLPRVMFGLVIDASGLLDRIAELETEVEEAKTWTDRENSLLATIQERDWRIAELEAENERLNHELGRWESGLRYLQQGDAYDVDTGKIPLD